jgi:ABC-type enterochelin transport system permease subunit
MLADIVRFFAAALLTQISFLIIFTALMYVWMQYESQAPLFLIMLVYIVYGWPFFFLGIGGFAIILSGPATLVIYSLLFAVIKIRMRDRYRRS